MRGVPHCHCAETLTLVGISQICARIYWGGMRIASFTGTMCVFVYQQQHSLSASNLVHLRTHILQVQASSSLIMALLETVLPLLFGASKVYSQSCTIVQPVFELPLIATSSVYGSTITITSSLDCDRCSLEVSTFRAILSGSTVSISLLSASLSSYTEVRTHCKKPRS